MNPRIGILGGTFDPVHIGHLVLAVCARDQLATDSFWLVPNARSPLKASTPIAPFPDRLHMLTAAVADTAGLAISDCEGARGGVSYTIDTLRHFHDRHPGAEVFLVMGTDALADFPAWKDHEEIRARARLVGVARGDAAGDLPVRLQHLIRMPRLDISSSLLRQRLAAGESIDFLTPRPVVDYIRARGLYRGR